MDDIDCVDTVLTLEYCRVLSLIIDEDALDMSVALLATTLLTTLLTSILSLMEEVTTYTLLLLPL